MRSARLRPTRRRGLTIVEAAVADDRGPAKAVWFNQAWLAERLRAGTRLLLYGKLDRSGFRVAAHEFVGGEGGAGIHTTGPRAGPSRHRAAPPAAAARVGLAGAAAGARTRSSRCRRSCALAAGWPARPTRWRGPLPRTASPTRSGRATGSRSRSSSCTRRRSRRAGRDARPNRPGIALGRPGELVAALASVAAVRAHRRPAARDRGDRRRPRRQHGRCSAC